MTLPSQEPDGSRPSAQDRARAIGASAVQKFVEEPYNCAEGVVAAFSEARGEPPRTLTALASPFGGGVGSLGHMCGALAGGLIVLGRRAGELGLARSVTRGLVQELHRGFEATFGTTACRELTAHDCEAAGGAPYDVRSCARYLAHVAEKTSELMDRAERTTSCF
ncbi:MAG: C_GCAxxG_C_C family protein [Polyangiaceae bacterium]|nr:C_GCAxxG_C_C family protein [Polyangiaceae bacterium]